MKNWTLRMRIVSGFATVLLLFALVAVTSFQMLKLGKAKLHQVIDDSIPGLETAADIRTKASEIQMAVLRHILAPTLDDKKGFEAEIQTKAAENQKGLDAYKKIVNSDKDREFLEKVIQTRQTYIALRGPVLELSRAGKTSEAAALNASSVRPAFVNFQKACEELYDLNHQEANTLSAECSRSFTRTSAVIVGAAILAVVVGSVIAALVIRSLTTLLTRLARSLADGANQVAAASSQVSSASQSLAEGASEQAASLEETSASLEEITSMVRRNSESAGKAKDLSGQTRAAADSGSKDMVQMQESMAAIKASSDSVAKIVKSIDEIAFQTNILALNAAVEAARAGEAGAGFAVVADEVRNLAQRSATAARETAEKIEDAIQKTGQGVAVSSKVAESLNQIIDKARKVDDLVGEIASASTEQAQGIDQVAVAISQMDKVTQTNAANAEESASASQELNAQAGSQKEIVGELLHLVGGSGPKEISKGSTGDHESVAPAPSASKLRNEKTPVNGFTRHHRASGPLLGGTKSAEELQKDSVIPMEDTFKDF